VYIYSSSLVHTCMLVLAARKIIQCMPVLGAHACRHGFLLACMPAASVTRMMFMLLSSSCTPTLSCGHVSAYGQVGGCAHALLSMWVHACLFSAICNKYSALISFGDICGSVCHYICGYPLASYSPTTIGPSIPRVLFPRPRPWGGGLPLSIMGAWQRNLRSVRGSADYVCLLFRHYLQHAPPKTRPPPHTTPLLVPHFPPTFLPPTPSNTSFFENILALGRAFASS